MSRRGRGRPADSDGPLAPARTLPSCVLAEVDGGGYQSVARTRGSMRIAKMYDGPKRCCTATVFFKGTSSRACAKRPRGIGQLVRSGRSAAPSTEYVNSPRVSAEIPHQSGDAWPHSVDRDLRQGSSAMTWLAIEIVTNRSAARTADEHQSQLGPAASSNSRSRRHKGVPGARFWYVD